MSSNDPRRLILTLAFVATGIGACSEPRTSVTHATSERSPAVNASPAPKRSGAPIQFECGKSRYEELTGKSLKDLDASFEYAGGGAASREPSEFAWAVFMICEKVVYFSIHSGPEDKRGAISGPAVDILVEPETNNNNDGVHHGCYRIGEIKDLSLIALVDQDPDLKEWPAKRAWQLDSTTGKIREINPQGINCIHYSYGHEGE